jgi:Na+/melibiose symporter-like transporter
MGSGAKGQIGYYIIIYIMARLCFSSLTTTTSTTGTTITEKILGR